MKKIKEEKPLSQMIVGQDALAVGVLRELISQIEDITPDKSGSALQTHIQGIKQMYHNNKAITESRLYYLLEEAKEVLKEADDLNIKSDKLYKVLIDILFLKARNNTFSKIFEDLEVSVRALLQLDYSRKPAILDPEEGKTSLFDYFSSTINLMIEKLETATVSRKGVNSIFRNLPSLRNIVIIITDKNGKIRFVNEAGEMLFNTDFYGFVRQPVSNLFEKYDDIEKRINDIGAVRDMPVSLVLPGSDKIMPAKLSLIDLEAIDECEDEIPEVVYTININPEKEENKLESSIQDAHDRIIHLNNILINAKMLNDKSTDDEFSKLITNIINSTNTLLTNTKDRYNEITDKLLKKEPTQVIDFKKITDEIITNLQLVDANKDIKFIVDVEKVDDFIGDYKKVYTIIYNLVSYAVKCRRRTQGVTSVIEISIGNTGAKMGVFIIVKDNGMGMDPETQLTLFERSSLVNKSVKESAGLYIVKEHVRQQGGKINVHSLCDYGTTFTLNLPYKA